jgi:hypothetical protein
VDVRPLTYTQLVNEIDELVEWLDRQTESSADTVRVEEGLATLRRELAQREARTRPKGRSRRKPKRGRAEEAPLPTRRPRILVEMTSVAYEDPAEMRAEYDLIMEWLPRPELSRAERQILEAERDNLAPQLQEERARATSQRRVARLQAALMPTEEDTANALEHAARTIAGIVPDPRDPNVFNLYHENEQIAISAEQFATLRLEVANQLRRGHRLIANDIDYYWNRYQAQVEINEDTFLIDDIAGWLGGVSDPGPELRMRRDRALRELERLDAHLSAGRFVQAAAMMGPLERQTQVIRGVSRAFYEGHIEGAERAVRGLEFTRDVSFAIAGSIAAVVAAPVVAGVAAGAGLTGATAAVATTVGTGVVVGTGTAVVRGTSAATGHLVAGSSGAEISEAFIGESVRGFREGFLSGAAGGAARVLGPMLGVGTQVGAQVVRRAAAGAIVDGTSAMLEVVMRGGSVEEAVNAGLRSAVLGIPGSLVGASGNRLIRELGGPLTAGATAYAGAIVAGASPEEAMRAAGVAVTTNVALSRATHRPETDARLEERGRAIGQDIRATARGAASRVRRTTAAIMIGTAEPVSGFRIGAGGTTRGVELQGPVVRQLPARPGEIAETPEVPTVSPAAAAQQAAAEAAPPAKAALPESVRREDVPAEATPPAKFALPEAIPPAEAEPPAPGRLTKGEEIEREFEEFQERAEASGGLKEDLLMSGLSERPEFHRPSTSSEVVTPESPTARADATFEALMEHVSGAQERFNAEGFTEAQTAAIERASTQADKNGARARFYGERVDSFVKESIHGDRRLDHLGVSEIKQPGPDFFDPTMDVWYDITTARSWSAHVAKYGLKGKLRGIHVPSGR